MGAVLWAADCAGEVFFAAAVRGDAEEEEAFDFLLGIETFEFCEESLGEEEPIEGFAGDQVAEGDAFDLFSGCFPAADYFEQRGVPGIARFERSTDVATGQEMTAAAVVTSIIWTDIASSVYRLVATGQEMTAAPESNAARAATVGSSSSIQWPMPVSSSRRRSVRGVVASDSSGTTARRSCAPVR